MVCYIEDTKSWVITVKCLELNMLSDNPKQHNYIQRVDQDKMSKYSAILKIVSSLIVGYLRK